MFSPYYGFLYQPTMFSQDYMAMSKLMNIGINPFNFSIQNSASSESEKFDPDTSRASCRECLITGVLTCTGLSAYFFRLASELQYNSAKEVTKQARRHKYFLYGGSGAWAMAGVYRLYLG